MGEQEKFARVVFEKTRGGLFQVMIGDICIAEFSHYLHAEARAKEWADGINTAHAQSLARFRERAAKIADKWTEATGTQIRQVAEEIAAEIRAMEVPL